MQDIFEFGLLSLRWGSSLRILLSCSLRWRFFAALKVILL